MTTEIIGEYRGMAHLYDHNTKQTSLEAYESIKVDGTKKSQTESILFLIIERPGLSRQDISKALGIAINAVCGRINELLKEGMIVENGTKKGNSGRKQAKLEVLND